jgi:hypothetical protein
MVAVEKALQLIREETAAIDGVNARAVGRIVRDVNKTSVVAMLVLAVFMSLILKGLCLACVVFLCYSG